MDGFDGHILRTFDGILIDGKLGINSVFSLGSGDGNILGALYGVVIGVMLVSRCQGFPLIKGP